MGATIRETTITGPSLQEAWKALCEYDSFERGHDYYQGSFNTCSLREIKEDLKGDESLEKMDKGEAYAYCVKKPVPNTNKVKTIVTNYPCKETRKWVTYYYALDIMGNPLGIFGKTSAECIAKSREYVEKHSHAKLSIHIGKRLEGLSSEVAEISYKKSSTQADGIWKIYACVPC